MAAAPPAPASLFARPDHGSFGPNLLGEARGPVVGAAPGLERNQPPPVREDGCVVRHRNRPFAAISATWLSGCGASEKTVTISAVTMATARVAPNTGWSSASLPSSKYITLMTRT